jgi:hypothetical protein
MHCARMFINTNKFGAAGQGRGCDQCWYIALSLLRPQTQRARAHTYTRPKVHSGGGRRINRVRVPQNKVSAGELMARENCINFNSTATCLNSKWAHFLRWKEQKRHKSTAPWWKMKSTRDAFLALSSLLFSELGIYLGARTTSRCFRWNLCDKLEMQVSDLLLISFANFESWETDETQGNICMRGSVQQRHYSLFISILGYLFDDITNFWILNPQASVLAIQIFYGAVHIKILDKNRVLICSVNVNCYFYTMKCCNRWKTHEFNLL